jgi:peptidyl-prolyl cis-trans isomerase C
MKFLYLLLGAALAFGQQTPPATDPVVLTLGTEKITKSQFELILAGLPDQQRAQAQTPAGRRRLAEQLVELKVLAQDARDRKLDQTPRAQTMLALQAEQILANLAYTDLGNNNKPDEAAERAYYNEHKQDWEEVTARHILIRMKGSAVPLRPEQKELTEAEALAKATELRAKIVAGADFAAVAKTDSDDTGNAASGGDLGSFGKGRMVPAFEKVAFTLEVGKISEPVKTQFGYHLIRVDAHATKSFDDVKADIAAKMKPEMAQKALAALKVKSPAVYDETFFGKEPDPKADPKAAPKP